MAEQTPVPQGHVMQVEPATDEPTTAIEPPQKRNPAPMKADPMANRKRPPNVVLVGVAAAAVVGLALCAVVVREASSLRFRALNSPFKSPTIGPTLPLPAPRPQRGK